MDHLPFGGGFSSSEELKDIVMHIPWGDQEPVPRLYHCFLIAPPLFLHPSLS